MQRNAAVIPQGDAGHLLENAAHHDLAEKDKQEHHSKIVDPCQYFIPAGVALQYPVAEEARVIGGAQSQVHGPHGNGVAKQEGQQLVAGVQNALRRQAKQVLHPVADMGIHQPRQPQMRHIVIIQPHGAVVRFGKEFVQHFVHSATSLLPSL